uniref:AlNc14C26G2604 protein n=1 Tax=Albugo laibachii Nc14 TaxID=890382 RepID=F0W6W8_9STRA|nr:AlNc14C26G2604 [Albugo laibachii Nc14]|eukprot:CCA16863.1 AlNc14C26G2604 [Albugo laibachii Nc14]
MSVQAFHVVCKKQSGQYDLECILFLDLSKLNLCSVMGLDSCRNLTVLDLSNNLLSSLEDLFSFPYLQSLNLARNQLTTIDDLCDMPMMESLILDQNSISTVDFHELAIKLPRLQKLTFRDNPLGRDINRVLGMILDAKFPKLMLANDTTLAFCKSAEVSEPSLMNGERLTQPELTNFQNAPADLDLEDLIKDSTSNLNGRQSFLVVVSLGNASVWIDSFQRFQKIFIAECDKAAEALQHQNPIPCTTQIEASTYQTTL